MFNELSVRLRLIRTDHDWFDASQMPHGTHSLFTRNVLALSPFAHGQFLSHRQAAFRSDSDHNAVVVDQLSHDQARVDRRTGDVVQHAGSRRRRQDAEYVAVAARLNRACGTTPTDIR